MQQIELYFPENIKINSWKVFFLFPISRRLYTMSYNDLIRTGEISYSVYGTRWLSHRFDLCLSEVKYVQGKTMT